MLMFFKTGFFLIFLLSFQNSFASIEKNIECSEDLQKFSKNYNAVGEWKVLSSNNKKTFYIKPTDTVGTWIQLIVYKSDKKVKIRLLNSESIKTFSFLSNCNIKTESTEYKKTHHTPSQFSYFDDDDLKELISSTPYGVVYMWSPRFTYSVKYFEETKRFVEDLGIPFKSLVKNSPSDLTTIEKNYAFLKSKTKEEITISASFELRMRGLELHSPSFLLYKNGKIINDIIVGVHTKKSLYKQLRGLK